MGELIDNYVRELINEYVLKSAKLYGGYYSSAQRIDEALLEKDIKTDFNFAYDYNLPHDLNPKEYEARAYEFAFYFACKNDHIEKVANAGRGTLLYEAKMQILNEYPKIEKKLEEEVEEIRKLNSETLDIKLSSTKDNLNFIMGVCYKFSINDIDWFINYFKPHPVLGEGPEHDFSKKMSNRGITVGYILCPEHKKILDDLTLVCN